MCSGSLLLEVDCHRYDSVDKNICIFENLEKVIFLGGSIENV